MNEILTQKLYKKYPHFFKQKYLPMNQTAMCWGIDCCDAWYDLLDKTVSKIVKVCPKATASQVKEKFATLRIYMSGSNDRAEKIVDEACSKSSRICEICGRKGKTIEIDHWFFALCPICTREVKKRGFREVAEDTLYLFSNGVYKKK